MITPVAGGRRRPRLEPMPVLDSRRFGPGAHTWSGMDGATLLLEAALIAVAYLCGSIPIGVVVARLTGGVDPRTVGSGRTGGTNALRALGRRRAAVVVVGDVLKGALPVLLARYTVGGAFIESLCAVAAVAGAIWSVFVGFRSGRGVGTGVGTMLVIQPLAVLIALPVFVAAILITRYVSLGSLLGSAAIAVALFVMWAVANGSISGAYLLYAVAGATLVWLAHADNIDRLIHGTERKFDLAALRGGGAAGEG
jgi:glycerol-3-phosphate acyltransferase PlsY